MEGNQEADWKPMVGYLLLGATLELMLVWNLLTAAELELKPNNFYFAHVCHFCWHHISTPN